MTLSQLKEAVDTILNKNPQAATAHVLVDTEARKFPAHLIEAEHVEFDQELCDAAGIGNFVTIYIDFKGAKA